MQRDPNGGFCVDIGAPKYFIRIKEARRLYNRLGKRIKLMCCNRKFRFADSIFVSLGGVMIPLPTPPGILSILVYMEVISCDVPALLGMDIRNMDSLPPCTVTNRLIRRSIMYSLHLNGIKSIGDWAALLMRYGGHLCAKISQPVFTFLLPTGVEEVTSQTSPPVSRKTFQPPSKRPSRGYQLGNTRDNSRNKPLLRSFSSHTACT